MQEGRQGMWKEPKVLEAEIRVKPENGSAGEKKEARVAHDKHNQLHHAQDNLHPPNFLSLIRYSFTYKYN